jgi:hypothetical protein
MFMNSMFQISETILKCLWMIGHNRESPEKSRNNRTDWHGQKLTLSHWGLHCFCQCYFVVHWGLQLLPVHDRCRACLSPSCVDAKQLDTTVAFFLPIVGSMIRCGSSCSSLVCIYQLYGHGSNFRAIVNYNSFHDSLFHNPCISCSS